MSNRIQASGARGAVRIAIAFLVSTALAGGALATAQEMKPVPKDSVRVAIPGCSKGALFLASRPAEDRPAGPAMPEGTRLRMLGPRKLMKEIKGQEGSRIEITGLIRRGQALPQGVPLGGGARISGGFGGPAAGSGRGLPNPGGDQLMIDVEGWRHIVGDCPR